MAARDELQGRASVTKARRDTTRGNCVTPLMAQPPPPVAAAAAGLTGLETAARHDSRAESTQLAVSCC